MWLLYGIQPKGARLSTEPGVCKGKAHKPQHLGIAGRRVLVSRKWSGKTLTDHARERAEFVRQLLERAHVRPGYAVDDGPYRVGEDPAWGSRPAVAARAAAGRDRRTTTLEGRLPRGPSAGRYVARSFGNSGGSVTKEERLTVAEVCAELRIARSTFYEWRAKHRAPR